MKVGIIADTHDHVPNIRKAVRVFNREQVGLVLHAGDFVAPFAVAALGDLDCSVLAVFGNNDGERLGLAARFESLGDVHPNLATIELADRRLAVVHYPELAEPLAKSGDFDLVVYGHTHEIDERREEALLLNPGEAGGWLTGRATVAVVELSDLSVRILDLDTIED
jgi:putative phosphoesterase